MPQAKRRTPLIVGLGVVFGTLLFRWRRHHRGPASVREVRHLELEPNPDGEGITIAVNPNAGSSGEETADELRRLLPAAEIIELDDPSDIEKVLQEAASRPGVRAIGGAGGDGTINCTAAIAADHGLPAVAIPGGTLNHLARDLGLSEAADTAAAVAAGKAISVDLATIDGRPFLNTASFGSYAELVDAREALEDRIGKWPALLVALVGVLRKGTPIEVELDGEPARLWMIFIGNCRYEPAGFAPSRRAHLDDGQLDIRVISAGHPYSRIRLVLGLLTGRLGRSPVYREWAATALHIRSTDGPLRLACDGETFDGSADVEVRKVGERVTLYSLADVR
jgi:diacylglycerol kinase family enzyme